MTYEIANNPAENRFETRVEGSLCVLDYRLRGNVLQIDHVGVPVPVEGRGIAAALTRAAMDWARAQGMKVAPICTYAAAWVARHPDYTDLRVS